MPRITTETSFDTNTTPFRQCPRCHNRYAGFSALSRVDNRTHICSTCGTDEAMRDYLGEPMLVHFIDPSVLIEGK